MVDFKKAPKGKGGTMLTKDVDMIEKNPLPWTKSGSGGYPVKPVPTTKGLETVAGSRVEPRKVAWDRVPKG